MEKHRREINGQLREVKGEEVKTYTFIASTSDPDRHRTVLNQNGWNIDNFNANPIIGYQHNLYGDICTAPDPDDVVGKGRAYVEGGKLMIDIEFDEENERAVKIQSKVDRGFLNTVSVGFIEGEDGTMGNKELGQDPDLYYFAEQELLEVSIVNIPSNPKAKKKAFRDQTFNALQYIYRELGGEHTFSEIEGLTVREILDKLHGEKKEIEKKPKRIEYKYNVKGGTKVERPL